jgi:RNA polymerase sigma factor (sigma-70 family)
MQGTQTGWAQSQGTNHREDLLTGGLVDADRAEQWGQHVPDSPSVVDRVLVVPSGGGLSCVNSDEVAERAAAGRRRVLHDAPRGELRMLGRGGRRTADVTGRERDEATEESFRRFVAARRGALLRTAWLLTGNRDDAEDLVQTALVSCARHWARVSAAGDPEAYVRRALVTGHVSAWRAARARVTTTPDGDLGSGLPGIDRAADPDPDRGRGGGHGGGDPSAGVDDRLVLAAALARLTPKQRAVLVLRFYEDLTEVQAAQVLGVGVGTVKSQTRHALQRLRELAPELEAFAPARSQEVTR